MNIHTAAEGRNRHRRLYVLLLFLTGCHGACAAVPLHVHSFGRGSAGCRLHEYCYLTPPVQPWGAHPPACFPLAKARGRVVSSKSRCNAQPDGTGVSTDQKQGGGKELGIKDLASSKWLTHQLHEYVQAREAEKRRRAYLLPRKKRLPLQNFHEDTAVIGKVVSLLPFGCRVDVGCLDTFGLLHVRDMHFLPEALKAGEEFIRESRTTPGGPVEPAPATSAEEVPQPSADGPETTSRAVSGWIVNVSDVLKVGDILSVSIKSIDRNNRRMRLTTVPAGEAEPESPRKAVDAFWVGQEVQGTVLRATPFGLFLDIGAVEDAFLHLNELRREDADEEVHQLYKRFSDSRKARRSSRSSSASLVPSVSREGDIVVDDPRYQVLHCRSGDRLTNLRVFDIDASRGRIQLTTRSEAEVQRLQEWRRRNVGMQEATAGQQKESQEEKIAKIRAALKLLERHRKKQQASISTSQPQDDAPSHQANSSGSSGDRMLAALFPGYSDQDIEEALSLLEAERRRKELLVLQETERRARKRHPRFLRQHAEDLTAQEAWQLLRKEEPGILTPEVLREDARRHAIRAGLSTADLPVFGPDGMPRLQQVPLKDLMPETSVGQSSGSAPPHKSVSGEVSPPSSSIAETDGERKAAGPASADSPINRLFAQTDTSGVQPAVIKDDTEDLVISPMKLQQELMAYDEELTGAQQPLADAQLGRPGREATDDNQQAQNGRGDSTPRAAGHANDLITDSRVTASDVDAFFAKSEAALLASLRKGRGKRDTAVTADQEEEIQELIRQDRERALKGIADAGSPSRGEAAEELPTMASTMEEAGEEMLGDVSHSEVLQTIRERLREEPELVQEVQRLGQSPEVLARKVQKILQHVRMPSVASSVLDLQDDLAALLKANISGSPERPPRASGRRHHEIPSSSVEEEHIEEAEVDSDDADEGFVSPLFQLPDDSPETNLSAGPAPQCPKMQQRAGHRHETVDTHDCSLLNIHAHLQSTAGRRHRALKTPLKGKRLPSPQAGEAVAGDLLRNSLCSGSKDISCNQLIGSVLPEDTLRNSQDQFDAAGSPRDTSPNDAIHPASFAHSINEHPQLDKPAASPTTSSASREVPSSQTPASKYLHEALSRARREAALATTFGVRRGAGSRTQRQRGKALTTSAAAAHDRTLHSSQRSSKPAAFLDPSVTQKEAQAEFGDVDETWPRRRRHSTPDILILPSDGRTGVAPEGTTLRPVRSLAELRKLQEQQSQSETRPREVQIGRKSKASSQEGKAPASHHRQLLNIVRRLHEQRGSP